MFSSYIKSGLLYSDLLRKFNKRNSLAHLFKLNLLQNVFGDFTDI